MKQYEIDYRFQCKSIKYRKQYMENLKILHGEYKDAKDGKEYECCEIQSDKNDNNKRNHNKESWMEDTGSTG